MKLANLSAIDDATICELFRNYSRRYTYDCRRDQFSPFGVTTVGNITNVVLPNGLHINIARSHIWPVGLVVFSAYDTRPDYSKNKKTNHAVENISVLRGSLWCGLDLTDFWEKRCDGHVAAGYGGAVTILKRALEMPACDWANHYRIDAKFDLNDQVSHTLAPTCEILADGSIEPRAIDKKAYVQGHGNSIWKVKRDEKGEIVSIKPTTLTAIPG